jgi:hypothetical protein
MRLLILEGAPRWTSDGELLDAHCRFSRPQLSALILSAWFQFGVPVLWTDSLKDTCDFIPAFASWTTKERHDSLSMRPKPSTPW